MPQPDFYNVNEHRIYPFTPNSDLLLSGGFRLSSRHLLDCGFTMGSNSGYNTGFKPVGSDRPHPMQTCNRRTGTGTQAAQ